MEVTLRIPTVLVPQGVEVGEGKVETLPLAVNEAAPLRVTLTLGDRLVEALAVEEEEVEGLPALFPRSPLPEVRVMEGLAMLLPVPPPPAPAPAAEREMVSLGLGVVQEEALEDRVTETDAVGLEEAREDALWLGDPDTVGRLLERLGEVRGVVEGLREMRGELEGL